MDINLTQRTLSLRESESLFHPYPHQHQMVLLTATGSDHTRIGLGECAPLPLLSTDSQDYQTLGHVSTLLNKAFDTTDWSQALANHPALLFALETTTTDFQHRSLFFETPFARHERGIVTYQEVCANSYNTLLAACKKAILRGHRSLMIYTHQTPWEDLTRVLQTLRSRFTPETLQIRLHAAGTFPQEEALQRLQDLVPFGIHTVVQPTPALWQGQGLTSWHQMAHLCQQSPIPIALDEELTGIHSDSERALLLDTIHPRHLMLRPMLHGGYTGCLQWIKDAQSRGIGFWLSHSGESHIGLRSLALFAGLVYANGPHHQPQGLAALNRYCGDIEMDLEMRSATLWRSEVAEDAPDNYQ